jgi:hypothetical protein
MTGRFFALSSGSRHFDQRWHLSQRRTGIGHGFRKVRLDFKQA